MGLLGTKALAKDEIVLHPERNYVFCIFDRFAFRFFDACGKKSVELQERIFLYVQIRGTGLGSICIALASRSLLVLVVFTSTSRISCKSLENLKGAIFCVLVRCCSAR